jgi:hypothetical protein
MTRLSLLDEAATKQERRVLAGLSTPVKIQAFLDTLSYSTENRYRCPLTVLRDRRAHCYDGGMFAAALLRRLGYPPLVVDLIPERDDNHLLALFKVDGHWGAVAKSNFAGLRYREPVYRTLRELVMSYFEDYYNLRRERTLRGYTIPLNLAVFDKLNWLVDDAALDAIADRLGVIRSVPLLTPAMVARLSRVDRRSFQSGMLGTDMAGVYRPGRR